MGKKYLAFYLLPFACLLGFLVGSWGPRADLQALRELTKNEKRADAERKPDGLDTFARMAKIPETAKHPRHRRQARTDVRRSVIAVTNAPKAEVTADVSGATNAVAAGSHHVCNRNAFSALVPTAFKLVCGYRSAP